MLYALNLFSDVYQLFLNKTGEESISVQLQELSTRIQRFVV